MKNTFISDVFWGKEKGGSKDSSVDKEGGEYIHREKEGKFETRSFVSCKALSLGWYHSPSSHHEGEKKT